MFATDDFKDIERERERERYCLLLMIYVSNCSTSIQIPHIQTVLTKHTEVAAVSHKM